MKPYLSVVLPCYNEEQAVEPVLSEILAEKNQVIEELGLEGIEVILVDDGSTDRSVQRAQKYQVTIHQHRKNRGYGAALKTGLRAATGEWIVFFDFDSTCHLRDVIQLYRAHEEKGYEVLSGERLQHDSQMPWYRKLGNQFFRRWVWLFTGKTPKDACSGYRLFHKSYAPIFIQQLPNELNFTLAMTVMAHKNRWPFGEVPVTYTERRGPSKLNEWVEGLRFVKTVAVYGFKKPVLARGVANAGSQSLN